MDNPNVARLARENAALRDVAAKAARLRRLGRACDQIEDGMEKMWREAPELTRSATGMLMAATAYETALLDFDRSLASCAEMFARDPYAEEIALHPTEANPPQPHKEEGETP